LTDDGRNDNALDDVLHGAAEVEEMPVEESRRAASLTLRSDDVREARAVSMEAANRSLADALRITYRGLPAVMIALVALFAFSGFEQVNQAESGIRVDLGVIQSERLDPGFQFAPPYPFGEIIKVGTGNRTLEINAAFWPDVPERDRGKPLNQVSARGDPLEPGEDGSLLTADSNIATANFHVAHSVANPINYVRSIKVAEGSSIDDESDFARAIVRAAVQRAAVHVVAEVPIDDLLKRGSGAATDRRREDTLESRIRSLAQAKLDEIGGSNGSGIEISRVILRSASPPIRVTKEFTQVQSAQSNAAKERDAALGESSTVLNGVAGSAHEPLLDLIDKYEAALDLGDEQRGEELRGLIMDVLDGAYNTTPDRPVVLIDGVEYENVRLSGEAAESIGEARRFAQTVAQRAQRQAETFRAKREQYNASPAVFALSEWSQAYKQFLRDPKVEIFWVPEGSEFEWLITPDPELARQRETQEYKEDVERNLRLQMLPEGN